jgi:hypothetical protein
LANFKQIEKYIGSCIARINYELSILSFIGKRIVWKVLLSPPTSS